MVEISVIVPVYNVEKYLCRCVDSILSQNYPDFELILVDDGSPDNCGKICDEYAGKDSRVTVIHQENGGLSAARNAGIEYALKTDSEWLTFIDSDDWVHKDYLKLLFDGVTEENVKISICQYTKTESFLPDENEYSYCCSNHHIIKTELIYSEPINAIQACTKLYHRSLFESVRFPVGKINEDRFTTHRLLFQTDRITVIAEKLYYYFQHSDSIMHREWSPKRMDDLEACREQISFFDKNGFEEAKMTVAKQYLYLLYDDYYGSVSYPEEHKQIKKTYNSAFDERKTLLSLNVRDNPKLYCLRHPFRAKMYFRFSNLKAILKSSGIKGVFRKIKSKFFPSERK
ncbi:MAG: glycosyltransferase [Lachnospiraceae bacterium]|nr:glycosyltransferase [Lachnospiraceae bacterium]